MAHNLRRFFPVFPPCASESPGTGPGRPADSAPRAQGWWRDLRADQAFWGVLTVWALCWLGWVVLLDRFGCPLPFADDYQACKHGLITGDPPVTLAFFWRPVNEHRMPLTRLWFLLLGRGLSWDFRAMRQVTVALVALSSLLLVLA